MSETDRRGLVARRALARLVDALLIAIPAGALAATGRLEASVGTWLAVAGVELLYFFVTEAIAGQTLGKQAMGLRVAQASGGRAGVVRVLIRTLARVVDDNPLGLLVVLVTGGRRQRIGDLLAGTAIVRAAHAPAVTSEPAPTAADAPAKPEPATA